MALTRRAFLWLAGITGASYPISAEAKPRKRRDAWVDAWVDAWN